MSYVNLNKVLQSTRNLSPKLPEPNTWLLVNHTKPTNTFLKLISYNGGQLQISERTNTKQRAITAGYYKRTLLPVQYLLQSTVGLFS